VWRGGVAVRGADGAAGGGSAAVIEVAGAAELSAREERGGGGRRGEAAISHDGGVGSRPVAGRTPVGCGGRHGQFRTLAHLGTLWGRAPGPLASPRGTLEVLTTADTLQLFLLLVGILGKGRD
jgi:hypothetical protein